ncbi:Glutathione S-transferase [Tyrophagus putrescentiae]|nr:Glutathione S-transferase [Tyrophagus putrescentiae]
MRHLGLEPKLKITSPLAGDTKTADFLKINPCHAIPVLNDDGFILNESRAILMYLCNKFPNGKVLYPEDAVKRANVDKLLFFDGTTLYPAITGSIMRPILRAKTKPSTEELAVVTEKMATLETIMGDSEFVAGNEVTIADISIAVTIPILKAMVNENFITAKLLRWYERVLVKIPALKQLNEEAFNGYIGLKHNLLSATSN